ncbi:EpsG family protein [Stutzerimonas azotifigens]|uniref:EpsG family protein n=1 Tax=Stutzerimonas azotifigens TaxID=291995 RepID=UPI000A079209
MNGTVLIYIYIITSWIFCILLHRNKSVLTNDRSTKYYKTVFFSLPPIILGYYFIALRPFNSGGDTVTYISSFNQISSPLTATADANYGTEIFFWPTQAFIKYFFEIRGWLIINFLVVTSLAFFSYKKLAQNTNISPLIFALVFMTFFAVYSGNAMRQVYSIPLGLIAFHYSYQRQFFRFLVFSLLAISFHWSATIILLSPAFINIPNHIRYYIAVPTIALACSPLIGPSVGMAVELTGFQWLTQKTDLYLRGSYISHISAVWKTMNFWLCVCIYIILIITKIAICDRYAKIVKIQLMFISLIFFSIQNQDISERYMTWLIFMTPISISLIILNLKLSPFIKNTIYATLFILMALLVFTRPSAIETLGINNPELSI